MLISCDTDTKTHSLTLRLPLLLHNVQRRVRQLRSEQWIELHQQCTQPTRNTSQCRWFILQSTQSVKQDITMSRLSNTTILHIDEQQKRKTKKHVWPLQQLFPAVAVTATVMQSIENKSAFGCDDCLSYATHIGHFVNPQISPTSQFHKNSVGWHVSLHVGWQIDLTWHATTVWPSFMPTNWVSWLLAYVFLCQTTQRQSGPTKIVPFFFSDTNATMME